MYRGPSYLASRPRARGIPVALALFSADMWSRFQGTTGVKIQMRYLTASCLLLLPLASGCGDDKGSAGPVGSTSGRDTTGGTTDGGPTGGATSGDGATWADTEGGSLSSGGTTGDSGETSLCEGACARLVACEFEEEVGECISWCDELRMDAAMADPRIFPECAALVDGYFECVAQDVMCLEGDLCSDLEFSVEEQCGCERGLTLTEDGCSYGERCGQVSREVHCASGTCVCTVGGEVAGECQSQAMICADPMGPDTEPAAIAAGECCGWVPFGE